MATRSRYIRVLALTVLRNELYLSSAAVLLPFMCELYLCSATILIDTYLVLYYCTHIQADFKSILITSCLMSNS